MLVAAIATGVDRFELIALLLSISFVLITEMVNTAVEASIDVATTSFDPLAKLAKDIAAGAVLIATVNAVAVGYLVFSDQLANRSSRLIDRLRDAPAELTLIALVLTIIVVIAFKAYTGRGTRCAAAYRPGTPRSRSAAGWPSRRSSATRALVPRQLGDVHHGVARGTGEDRDRSAFVHRGRLRRHPRCARRARRLPGAGVSAELLAAADDAAQSAYAPYSEFLVGAVARARDGRLFTGVNVENAAYPLGICAERCCPRSAATAGLKPGDLEEIAITRRAAAAGSGWPSGGSSALRTGAGTARSSP